MNGLYRRKLGQFFQNYEEAFFYKNTPPYIGIGYIVEIQNTEYYYFELQ